jgi:hypothetical protein
MHDMEAREVIHNLAAYLAHHHGTWVYTYFAAEDVELAQTCYWHEESQSMRSNKEKVWDNLMNWDTEFQVQIENMENMGNLDAAPPGAAAQNFVGSVDSMSFMDRHASAVSNNPRSMDAILKPPTSTSKLFPNATPPPYEPHEVHSSPLQYVPSGQFATNISTNPLRYVNISKYRNVDLSIGH